MKKLFVILVCVSVLTLGLFAGSNKGNEDPFAPVPYDKLHPLVKELKKLFANSDVQQAFQEAIDGVQDFKGDGVIPPFDNIWKGKTNDQFCYYFHHWYDFVSTPTKEGLGFIVPFTHFYYDNDKALEFLNDKTFEIDGKKEKAIYNWTVKFIKARGRFMDQKNNQLVLDAIKEWEEYPEMHIEEYIRPEGGYATFNDFFARELRPGARPVAAVGDDSVAVASADSVINMINSALTEDSKIPTKGNRKLGVKELLKGYPDWKSFIGGTAISCVLLPSDYHHYHAPVSGKLVYYKAVPGIYFGIKDAPEWFHAGNVGAGDANFSIFEQFHRDVFIFDTKYKKKDKCTGKVVTVDYGKVAMVAVGLNTISKIGTDIGADMKSVNTLGKFQTAAPEKPIWVYEGTRLGHFKYGGSLNILLFEEGVYQATSLHQGQRIGTLSTPQKK